MIYRLIAPKWLVTKGEKKVIEGELSWDEVQSLNKKGYNVFTVPNHPSTYSVGTVLSGGIIDLFDYVFVDFDLKQGFYQTKQEFIDLVTSLEYPPSKIVDSGNGVHAYWRITDLDAMSYLRLSRRLQRTLRTDDAVGQIFQLMRVPGTLNTKDESNFIPCTLIYDDPAIAYTCEELDSFLPPISPDDEKAAKAHFDKTYALEPETPIDDKLPPKWGALLMSSPEAKSIWMGELTDRSGGDYRLGHLMFASGFSKAEATSVLVNSAKALGRGPSHRRSYATNIVDKIWTFENPTAVDAGAKEPLSRSIRDIIQKPNTGRHGERIPCHPRIDNTDHGFRLGDVLGLIGGSGIGKTSFALNIFLWFSEKNPNLTHFFVPLEQPVKEIADRWVSMTKGREYLHNKVQLISNYDDSGNFRHLSFKQIQEYIENWQKETGLKVGCVVIDHIGALEKSGKGDDTQDIMNICHSMKAFAVQTNTFLIMQSQTSREKAGIGDLELDKDAAFGTSSFEWYCDYVVTMWQPLKRCHAQGECPTVTAFKYCKIRHKKIKKDIIQEDVPYFIYFDSETELFRDMTEDDKKSFEFWLPVATNKRKEDRKTSLVTYSAVPYNSREGVQLDEAERSRRANNH